MLDLPQPSYTETAGFGYVANGEPERFPQVSNLADPILAVSDLALPEPPRLAVPFRFGELFRWSCHIHDRLTLSSWKHKHPSLTAFVFDDNFGVALRSLALQGYGDLQCVTNGRSHCLVTAVRLEFFQCSQRPLIKGKDDSFRHGRNDITRYACASIAV